MYFILVLRYCELFVLSDRHISRETVIGDAESLTERRRRGQRCHKNNRYEISESRRRDVQIDARSQSQHPHDAPMQRSSVGGRWGGDLESGEGETTDVMNIATATGAHTRRAATQERDPGSSHAPR